MQSKGVISITGLVILGLILAVALGGSLFKGSLLPSASTVSINGKTCSLVEGKGTFLRPQFGRIECQPIQNSHKEVKKLDFHKYLGDTDVIITFGDVENAPEGYFSVNCVNSKYFDYQTDARFANGKCPLNSKQKCTAVVSANMKVRFNSNTFRPGEKLRIIGCHSYFAYKSGTLYSNYIPYGLVVYDSGMKKIYNTKNCRLTSLSSETKRSICKKGDGTACEKSASQTTLNYDDFVNYLSDWTPVPMDVSKKVVDYQGQKAYCQIDKLYSIGSFETASGCYYYPKEAIASVACCPGMVSANGVCGDDFSWHKSSEVKVQCKSDLECMGQGQYIPDYSKTGQYVSKWSCINGQCRIINSKKVKCLPPDIGCPSGQLCNVNKGYVCEYQKGNIPVKCGDGICSSPYESKYSCPADCHGSSKVMSFFKRILFAFITSLGLIGIGIAVPFTRPYLVSNIRRTMLIAGVLTIIFALFFTAPLFFTASLLGGV